MSSGGYGLWSNHTSPPLTCFSPRIDGGTDSRTSHLAIASHPPRTRLPVCLPDRRRDLADLLVRDRVEGCDLAVPPPPDESPCPGYKDAVEEEDRPRRRRCRADKRLERGRMGGERRRGTRCSSRPDSAHDGTRLFEEVEEGLNGGRQAQRTSLGPVVRRSGSVGEERRSSMLSWVETVQREAMGQVDVFGRRSGHGLEQAPLALPVDLGKRREVVLPPLWDDEAAVG